MRALEQTRGGPPVTTEALLGMSSDQIRRMNVVSSAPRRPVLIVEHLPGEDMPHDVGTMLVRADIPLEAFSALVERERNTLLQAAGPSDYTDEQLLRQLRSLGFPQGPSIERVILG